MLPRSSGWFLISQKMTRRYKEFEISSRKGSGSISTLTYLSHAITKMAGNGTLASP